MKIPAILVAVAVGAATPAFSAGQVATKAPDALLIEGPLESIDNSNGNALVLGQWVTVGAARVERDHIVAVYGGLHTDGTISVTRVVDRGQNVAGATPLLVTGTVRSVDVLTGHAVIGALTVDYTSTIRGDQSATLAVNEVVRLTGIQPVERGIFVAYGLSAYELGVTGVSGVTVQGVTGVSGVKPSGVTGVSGVTVQGVTGVSHATVD